MEFDEVLTRRRMTRRFRPDPLAGQVLEPILRAGTRAPSAGFTQGVDLLVLSDERARREFWEASSDAAWRESGPGASGLLAAPVVILPVADPESYAARYAEHDKRGTFLFDMQAPSWPTPFWLVDASFATMAILLAATSQRVGALFFQLHAPEEAIKASLDIPEAKRLIGGIALGYPEGSEAPASPSRRARRALDEVVHKERW